MANEPLQPETVTGKAETSAAQPRLPENNRMYLLLAVSDATGIGYTGVDWIAYTITNMLKDSEGRSIESADIVLNFIKNLLETGSDVETLLTRWHIKDSTDVGRVVFALCEQGMFGQEDKDTAEEFKGLFISTEIRAYIKQHDIKPPTNNYHRICYVIGSIGGILIFWASAAQQSIHYMTTGWVLVAIAFFALTFEKNIRKKKN